MLGRQHVLKPIGTTGQIEVGFFGYVRRVVVQNDPDRAIRRIVVVKILEERNKFAASVPPFDASCDMAFMEIQRGKNGTGAEPLVFMIAAHVGMLARDRPQIGGGIGDGLKAWFFIDGNSNDGWPFSGFLAVVRRGVLQSHLLLHQQHIPHLDLEGGVALFQIIADSLGMQSLLRQDPLHGGFGRTFQRRMSRL